jgi:ABC-type multidrug transport system ATPase subunit
MNSYSLSGENILKTYGRRLVFRDLNFSFTGCGVWGVAGPNGSGKSTLAKIIAGVISPTKGKVEHMLNDKKIESENIHKYIGFVSPYLIITREKLIRYLMNFFFMKDVMIF